MPKYEVDEDTKDLLQEILGLAQRVVDLQYDEEMGDALQDMLIECSEQFGIESHEVRVTVAEDGTITAKIEQEASQPLTNSREGIKLVSDNTDKIVELKPRERGELPPGFHLTPDEPQSGPAPDSDND